MKATVLRMSKAVKLPPGIGAEANDRLVKFQFSDCEGTGRLAIWKTPRDPDKYMVTIQITEAMDNSPTPAIRTTMLEISPHNALLLRKSEAGLPHEYEILGGEAVPPDAT